MNVFAMCLTAVSGCYLTAAVGTGLALLRRNRLWKTVAARLAGLAFLVHSFALGLVLAGLTPWNDLYFLPAAAWLFMLAYVLIRRGQDTAFLTMVCAGTSGALILLGLILEEARLYQVTGAEYFTGPLFTIHLSLSFAALASMLVGCGAGLAFLYMDKKIRGKAPLSALDQDFPALTGLDRLGRLSALWGFPLFTLGLSAGFIWAGSAFGRAVSWDIKEVVSLAVWLAYAALFVWRLLGRRGRKPAWLAVAVFVLSMFSLFVVNALLPSHHSFMAPSA